MKKVLYILGELDDQDLEWLIKTGQRKRLHANDMLIEENRPIHAFYIVIEGAFSIRISAANNKEVARLGAGEVVGEMSYVDSRPPSASVVAMEDSLVLEITRTALNEKLEQDMSFATHFYRALAIFLSSRLRETTSQFGYGSAVANSSGESDMLEDDELDLDQLSSASKGGIRFDQMLKRLKGL